MVSVNFVKFLNNLKRVKFLNISKKSQIVFYDKVPDLYIKKIFKFKKYSCIYDSNRNINFFIFISIFFKYKTIKIIFSDSLITAYLCSYISFLKPKIIINTTDNDLNFYRLKKHFKNIYFISIQNGSRHIINDLFGNTDLTSQANLGKFSADYIFTFNKYIGQLYEKFIYCRTIAVGKLINNKLNVNLHPLKNNKIIFISQFREKTLLNNYYYSHGKKVCTTNKWLEAEQKLFPKLCDYANKRKLNLYVFGTGNNMQNIKKEKQYFKKIANGKNWEYFNPYKFSFKERYLSLRKFELIVSIWSTLAYELFSRFHKVCFFRQNIKNLTDRNFGWPLNLPQRNFWYSNLITQEEVNRVLDNLRLVKKNAWTEKVSLFRGKVMQYDRDNYKINKIIEDCLK